MSGTHYTRCCITVTRWSKYEAIRYSDEGSQCPGINEDRELCCLCDIVSVDKTGQCSSVSGRPAGQDSGTPASAAASAPASPWPPPSPSTVSWCPASSPTLTSASVLRRPPGYVSRAVGITISVQSSSTSSSLGDDGNTGLLYWRVALWPGRQEDRHHHLHLPLPHRAHRPRPGPGPHHGPPQSGDTGETLTVHWPSQSWW